MPGNIAELRGLVTVVSFLSLFAVLTVMIPPQFFAESYEGRELSVPEYFEGIDFQYFAETWNYQMNETGGYSVLEMYHVDIGDAGTIGGHKVQLVYSEANRTHHDIRVTHIYYQWVIFPADHDMEFLFQGASRGTTLTATELNSDIGNGQATYSVQCEHVLLRMSFGYNTTTYDDVTTAWNHHDVYVFVGIDFDQVNTTLNAWSIIGMILFFQMPDVHVAINMVIAIPLWICIAYLAYVLILKAIPFVSG